MIYGGLFMGFGNEVLVPIVTTSATVITAGVTYLLYKATNSMSKATTEMVSASNAATEVASNSLEFNKQVFADQNKKLETQEVEMNQKATMYYISKILDNITAIQNIIKNRNNGKALTTMDFGKVYEVDTTHHLFSDLSGNQSTCVLVYNKEVNKYLDKYSNGYDFNDGGGFIAESTQLVFSSSICFASIYNN